MVPGHDMNKYFSIVLTSVERTEMSKDKLSCAENSKWFTINYAM